MYMTAARCTTVRHNLRFTGANWKKGRKKSRVLVFRVFHTSSEISPQSVSCFIFLVGRSSANCFPYSRRRSNYRPTAQPTAGPARLCVVRPYIPHAVNMKTTLARFVLVLYRLFAAAAAVCATLYLVMLPSSRTSSCYKHYCCPCAVYSCYDTTSSAKWTMATVSTANSSATDQPHLLTPTATVEAA